MVVQLFCSFWASAQQIYGGADGTLLQEGLCHMLECPRSAAARAPVPAAIHCRPLSPQLSTADLCLCRRHSTQFWLSLCGNSGSWCAQGLIEPFECLWWVWGLILNVISPLLLSFWGFSFALGCGVSFFGGIQHFPVDGCSAASCNFGVLAGEDEHMSFYSTILDCHM